MDKIVIEGGKRLSGEVKISGAKNAALPILVSSLLADGWSTFTNVPDLRDIRTVCKILENHGATVLLDENDSSVIRINGSGLNNFEAPYDLVRQMRASILVLCPIVARLKKARISLPGGCAIGARPINLHLKGLEKLGAKIELKHGYVEASAEKLIGAEIYFDIPTVTGTENLMMAAVLAEGRTILGNAAMEPEIVALADVLNNMGADVRGAGTSEITINGVDSLQPVNSRIIPDRIETGTFITAAALTKGDITITDCEPSHISAVINKFELAGVKIKSEKNTIHVQGQDVITSVDVKTLPFPGFPTDMQAQFMVLMCAANGTSMITETIFENRFIHVSELKRLGAMIKVSGNTALITGGAQLSGAPVMATDLRASASLILAGLIAKDSTSVSRVYHLDRGYEALEKKFANLGASIKRVPE